MYILPSQIVVGSKVLTTKGGPGAELIYPLIIKLQLKNYLLFCLLLIGGLSCQNFIPDDSKISQYKKSTFPLKTNMKNNDLKTIYY